MPRLLRHARPTGLLMTLAAAVLAGACTTTLILDDENLETTIAAQFQQQTGVALESVSCPDNTPIEQGNIFQCTATAVDGQALTIEVTQTDNTGNVSWRVV